MINHESLNRQRKRESFEDNISRFQPCEIIDIIFAYFACALKDASDEKLHEFFCHFNAGVSDFIKLNRDKS